MNTDIAEEILQWEQLNTVAHYSVAWLQFKHLNRSIQALPVFLLPARHKTPTLQATVLLGSTPDFHAYSKGWGHSCSSCMVLKEKTLSHPRKDLLVETEVSQAIDLTTYVLETHFPTVISVLLLSRLLLPRVHPISPLSESPFWIRYMLILSRHFPSGKRLLPGRASGQP